jgi:hypothetical protein
MVSKFFLILIVSGILTGCINKAPIEFSIHVKDDTDQLDSETKTFTRRYILGDSIININLTQNDLDRIYSKYLKYKLDKLPRDYDPNCGIGIIPNFSSHITIKYDDQIQKITYVYLFKCRSLEDTKRMENIGLFLKDLEKILSRKPAYKNLPNSNLIFM